MAHTFHAYCGLRYEMPPGTNTRLLEEQEDPRQLAAKRFGLSSWWGRLTDGGYIFLLVGQPLAQLGETGVFSESLDSEALARLVSSAQTKLLAAGFDGATGIHLQLEAEF